MSRIMRAVLLVSSVGSVVFAQDGHRGGGGEGRYQSMPLASNLLLKTPKLKSWVTGWKVTGTRPEAYELRCEDVFTDCAVPILRTKTFSSEPFGMGSLTHAESAEGWRGSRVELKAELRAGRIDGWAGLWMRIDGPEGKVLAFDNMQNRPLRGTSSFAWYSVVLDVPKDAEKLTFGVLLHGPGAVFIRELQFEAVDTQVSSTDLVAPLRAVAR